MAVTEAASSADRRAPAAAAGDRPGEPAWHRTIARLLLAALAAAFVIQGWATVAAPFGDSDDGRNGGVWAKASRSLREDPLASRLGARTDENGTTSVYSNHPPLIIGQTAVAEAIAGERPWASRMPAWLGSLALIPLTYLLVRELLVSRLAAAAGVAVGLGCPMFFLYGTMLDTPVTSLPIVAAFLLVWLRSRHTKTPPHPVLHGSMAALAVLAGWQGLLTTAVLVAWGAVILIRQRRRPTGERVSWPIPLALGAMTGVVLVTAWAWWSHDSLAYLLDQFRFRSGEGRLPISLHQSLLAQGAHLRGLVAIPVMAAALTGLWLGIRRPDARPLIVVLMIATAGYSLLFRSGAYFHSYWNYWIVLLAAIGLAVVADRLVHSSMSDHLSPRFRATALVTVTVALVGVSLASPVLLQSDTTGGGAAGELAEGADWPDHQRVAWYYRIGEPPSFLEYYARRPVERLPRDPRVVPADDLVLAKIECLEDGSATIPEYVIIRAGDMARYACLAEKAR